MGHGGGGASQLVSDGCCRTRLLKGDKEKAQTVICLVLMDNLSQTHRSYVPQA